MVMQREIHLADHQVRNGSLFAGLEQFIKERPGTPRLGNRFADQQPDNHGGVETGHNLGARLRTMLSRMDFIECPLAFFA